jgi:hypothetical protein
MYIILDGSVDFNVDLMKHPITQIEIDQLTTDLSLNKKELIKMIIEFKRETGLDKHNGIS